MNHSKLKILIPLSLLIVTVMQAQLAVTVFPPKVVGQKAIVKLTMKNDFAENIKFARAACFLLDEHGTMMGQSARWVVNKNLNKIGLAAGTTNEFNFVITSPQPFSTTNLTTKVSFSRVVLQSGHVVNIDKQVQIQNAGK